MHLIDSHCHLDFKEFDSDREDILLRCHELGIDTIFVPGVTAKKWSELLAICQSSEILQPALGLHPMFMSEHKPEHVLQLKVLASEHPIIAIGEIGLDFYHPNHNKKTQITLFSEQLSIAQSNKLPVLLHVRKAHDQTISLLKQYPVSGGIVHAFSGSIEQAREYQKLGFLLGIGGAMTHPRATRLRAMISQLPLSSIALETDAPDMPLFNMSTVKNTPENISIILAELSNLRSESESEITERIQNSIINCFKFKPCQQ